MSYDLDLDYRQQFAKKTVENSKVLLEEKLPTFVKLSDSLLDENVNITMVEEYCEWNTFIKLKQLAKEKSALSLETWNLLKVSGKKTGYIMSLMSASVTLQFQQTEGKTSWKLVLYKVCS